MAVGARRCLFLSSSLSLAHRFLCGNGAKIGRKSRRRREEEKDGFDGCGV